MNRKLIALGAMLLTVLATTTGPVYAETAKDTARIEKLEERTRDLEARIAKIEASSQEQVGKMMQHEQGMMGKGMGNGTGANNPMGQMPQQVPQQNQAPAAGMPKGGAQPQDSGMPAGGGMGHM